MWSPDALHVGLAARQLTLVTAAGRWTRSESAIEIHPCAPADGAPPWQAAVDELARRLAERGGRRPALRVVLSGPLVRWQLLAWRPELAGRQELAAYSRLRFRETYGPAADDWSVLHVPQPPGGPLPACAVDEALLEALRRTSAEAGARLLSVSPYFAAAFDRWRGARTGGSGWFGVLERDCLTLGLLRRSEWAGLRSQRLQGEWAEPLAGLMAQLGIPAAVAPDGMPLYLAGEAAPEGAGPPHVWLQPHEAGRLPGGRLALGV